MRYLLSSRAYGDAPRQNCFWQTTAEMPAFSSVSGSERCDTAVIGAGFTGLSAALRLAEAGVDVAVLDAHAPGWGASGRNGGFCCLGGAAVGSTTIARRYGKAAAQEYARAEREAVDHVAATIDRLSLDVDRHSEGETLLAHAPSRIQELTAHGEAVQALHGLTCTQIARDELPAHGLSAAGLHGALTVDIGFALNPFKYTCGLVDAVTAAGGRIFGGSRVNEITSGPAGGFVLRTAAGEVHCNKVIFATNGYTAENLTPWLEGRFIPSQSHVLVTRPLTDAELAAQGWNSAQMCYDTLNFLHYFRLMPDRRFLFGIRGTSRSDEASVRRTETRGRSDFDRMFPAWSHVETEFRWSGLICTTMKRLPFAGPVDGMPGAYASFAYHGNGVAMGSYCGTRVAERSLGQANPPVAIQATPGRFPLARTRRIYLEAANLLHRLGDWLP